MEKKGSRRERQKQEAKTVNYKRGDGIPLFFVEEETIEKGILRIVGEGDLYINPNFGKKQCF